MRGECMKYIYAAALLSLVMLSGCTPTARDSSGEIKQNSWKAELRNGDSVSLSFSSDFADLKISGKSKAEIKGLCVIDKESMIIYGDEPYAFSYTLRGDSLILRTDDGKLKLLKN